MVAIDNDEVLLLMLKEMYAQEGIHCDTCTNAAELMELIRKKEYSLLLTDLNMPDINGFLRWHFKGYPGSGDNSFGQLRQRGTYRTWIHRMPVQAVLHI